MKTVSCGTTLMEGSYPDEPLSVVYPVSQLSGVFLDFAVALVGEKFDEVRLLYAPHGRPPEATLVSNGGSSDVRYKALEDQDLAHKLLGSQTQPLDIGTLRTYVASIAGNQILIPLPGNAWRKLFPAPATA